MAFTNSWVETDPDGAVITGSLLDDHQRLTKRAVRERLEGDPANPNSGIFEAGSFAATAIVKAGSARAYMVTAANLGTLTLQDGRIAITSDTARMYHLKGSGLVELAYLPLAGGGNVLGSTNFVNIAISGTFLQNGLAMARFEANGGGAGGAGPGIEIYKGGIQSYNRTTVALGPMQLDASAYTINGPATFNGSISAFSGTFVIELATNGTDMRLQSYASKTLNINQLGNAVVIGGITTINSSLTVTGAIVGTLNTAAQPNITSLGVVTGLVSSGTITADNYFGVNRGGVGKGFFGAANAPNQIINGAALDDLVIRSNGFAIRFSVDSGGSSALILGSSNNVIMSALGKLYIDGGSDTYMVESAANQVDLYTGGAVNWRATTTTFALNGKDFIVDPAKRLYLDSGFDTYILESTANNVTIVTGGANSMQFGNGYVIINPTNKFYLDGGSDTYIFESSANLIDLYAGGARAFYASTVEIGTPLSITMGATKRFYLDGGGDTYITETSANQFDLVVGNIGVLRSTTTVSSFLNTQLNVTTNLGIKFGAQDAGIFQGTANTLYIGDYAGATIGLRVNYSTGLVSATGGFSGALTGNVTGNVTGNITGTVLTASQTNITAVGTLGTLTVSGAAAVGTLNVGSGTVVQKWISVQTTWDPPSIAAGGFTDTSVTVTGAAVGDLCIIDAGPWANVNLISHIVAKVSAADTVYLRLVNYTAGAIDPTSQTFRIWVIKF